MITFLIGDKVRIENPEAELHKATDEYLKDMEIPIDKFLSTEDDSLLDQTGIIIRTDLSEGLHFIQLDKDGYIVAIFETEGDTSSLSLCN